MNVYRLETTGPLIATPADASQLIGATWGQEVELIVIPVARLHPDFFRLSTGLAGEVLQKLVNHHLRLAVLGDVSEHLAQSEAFRDFVRESNRGRHAWFVADEEELAKRLAA